MRRIVVSLARDPPFYDARISLKPLLRVGNLAGLGALFAAYTGHVDDLRVNRHVLPYAVGCFLRRGAGRLDPKVIEGLEDTRIERDGSKGFC
jgi:hypothetical protein